MVFATQLRDGIRRGEITRTVRIWQRCHVKAGGRYRIGSRGGRGRRAPDPIERRSQAPRIDRLEQVIERIHLERPQGVLVVRRRENDLRHVRVVLIGYRSVPAHYARYSQ